MADPEKVKPYGLTQVYCSKGPPLVDIVFVHGLNGHPSHTWTSKSGAFWPAELLPEVLERVRILTYGYNAEVAAFKDGSSRDHIHHHAETLASGLAANRNVSLSEYFLLLLLMLMLICCIASKVPRAPDYLRLPFTRGPRGQAHVDLLSQCHK